MIKTVGKKFRRAMHFDFHTSPGVKNILQNFDAEKFADQLAASHIEYVNLTARCNMGYSYYNTAVGKKYPGLQGRDPFGEALDACHKKGIGVTAYINVGLDHEMAADHPGWLKMDREGKVYRENKKDSFFRMMCHNTPYRAHFLAEVKEICRYDIDGLFCDCFELRECFCPACMTDMARLGVDIRDDSAVLDYQKEVRRAFAEEIREAVGEKRNRIKIYFNGMSRTAGYQTHAEVECLPSEPQWGYDCFDSMAAYTRTMYEDRVYMSARFQNSWGDFGGLKPVASMQNDLYDAMMNGFGMSFGDHLHPIDGFEEAVASRVRAVMEEKMAYEPYVENAENLTEIGVLVHANDRTYSLPYFVKGVARMMKELKLTYNIYDEKGAFDDDGVKLLLVGENADFDETCKQRLRRYIEKGGKVIFSGTAIDLGKKIGALDFLDMVENDTRDNAYYTVDGGDMRIAMYAPSRVIRNAGGMEVAKYVGNIVNYTWDGRQSCEYRPQGEPTEYSAAVIRGNQACICFDIFRAYADSFLTDHRELVKKLIDEMLPEKQIEAPEMPKTATVSLTKTAHHTVFHVKATYPEHKMNRGIIEEHTYMKSVPVSIRGAYESVYILPGMQKVESRVEQGRTVFATGEILGYRAFLLQEKEDAMHGGKKENQV